MQQLFCRIGFGGRFFASIWGGSDSLLLMDGLIGFAGRFKAHSGQSFSFPPFFFAGFLFLR